MVRPIEPTPTLRGKDAIAFIKAFRREQTHPTKARLKTLKEASRIKFRIKWHDPDLPKEI